MIELENPDLPQIRELYQNQIPIDLEEEEIPLRKELFEKTVSTLQYLPFTQFKLLEKDYLKLKHQITKIGLEFSNDLFE